jgi:hypothetical protein
VGERDGELPLAEAMAAWGDPALDEALQQAISAAPPGTDRPMIFVLGLDPWEEERQDERLRLRQAIWDARQARMDAFKHQLETGELVGSGWEAPLTLGRGRRTIQPGLWRFLELDLDASSAKGAGLELLDIRVRRTPAAAATKALAGAEGEPRRRGPSTLIPEVRTELIERAGRDVLKPTVTDECRSLEQWVKRKYPKHPRPPSWKTIYNALAKEYHELMGARHSRVETRAP